MKKPLDFKSRREWENFLWDNFLEHLIATKSKQELKRGLEKVISEAERQIIIKRLTAIVLLKENKSYKEIGELLWISPSTISAIKKNFFNNGIYKSRRKIELSEGRGVKKIRNNIQRSDVMNKKIQQESVGSTIWEFLKYLDANWPSSAYNDPKKRWEFLSKH